MPLFIFFPPSPKIHVSFHCVQSVSVAVAWVSLETAAGQTMIGCVVSLIAVFQAVGPLSAAPKQVNRGLSKGFALVVWKKPHRWHLGECVTQGHWFEENRRQQGMKKKKEPNERWMAGWLGWRSLAAVKTGAVSSLIEGAADSRVPWWSWPWVPQLLGLECFVSCLILPVYWKYSEAHGYLNTVLGGKRKERYFPH